MRTNYIGKSFQMKTALNASLMTLASAAVFCATVYLLLKENISGGFSDALETVKTLRFSLPYAIGLSETAALGLLTTGIVILGIRMSHKLAGPLWRVEKTARQVADGDLSFEISLRENDEAQELARQMNCMLRGLREKVSGIREAYARLDDCARRLKDASEPERGAILNELHRAAGELSGRLDLIKTSN